MRAQAPASVSNVPATDVVVIGSGPNGLAAAVVAARAGLSVVVVEAQPSIGGGARTLDLQMADGVVHDICSAVHPMALASPFLAAFDLAARGVDLLVPEVSFAHPLDGGQAGVAYRDLARTVAGLGTDGPAWKSLFGPLVEHQASVVEVALGDHRHVPHGLVTAIRMALRMLEQGSPLWHTRFGGDAAPALLSGVAAHAITQLPSLSSAGTALLLGSLAHGSGWPIPRGGSQVITDALVADLSAHGGRIDTDTEATSLSGLPPARAYIFDTTPRTLARVAGGRLPERYRRALAGATYGNAAAKVDFVLSGPVPWTHPEVARAGTVHLGGSRGDMVEAEAAVAAGRHADHPMVLASDPAVMDQTRIGAGGLRPFWTYAHVPANSTLDPTEAVTAQVERFAPGFRDLIVASSGIPASKLSDHNANYPGGDIAGGRITLPRVLLGPVPRWDPYATPVPDVFIASSSTPPGPGVHGMAGFHAAKRVLRRVFGIRELPELAP